MDSDRIERVATRETAIGRARAGVLAIAPYASGKGGWLYGPNVVAVQGVANKLGSRGAVQHDGTMPYVALGAKAWGLAIARAVDRPATGPADPPPPAPVGEVEVIGFADGEAAIDWLLDHTFRKRVVAVALRGDNVDAWALTAALLADLAALCVPPGGGLALLPGGDKPQAVPVNGGRLWHATMPRRTLPAIRRRAIDVDGDPWPTLEWSEYRVFRPSGVVGAALGKVTDEARQWVLGVGEAQRFALLDLRGARVDEGAPTMTVCLVFAGGREAGASLERAIDNAHRDDDFYGWDWRPALHGGPAWYAQLAPATFDELQAARPSEWPQPHRPEPTPTAILGSPREWVPPPTASLLPPRPDRLTRILAAEAEIAAAERLVGELRGKLRAAVKDLLKASGMLRRTVRGDDETPLVDAAELAAAGSEAA